MSGYKVIKIQTLENPSTAMFTSRHDSSLEITIKAEAEQAYGEERGEQGERGE